jgi:hypothetical protein
MAELEYSFAFTAFPRANASKTNMNRHRAPLTDGDIWWTFVGHGGGHAATQPMLP